MEWGSTRRDSVRVSLVALGRAHRYLMWSQRPNFCASSSWRNETGYKRTHRSSRSRPAQQTVSPKVSLRRGAALTRINASSSTRSSVPAGDGCDSDGSPDNMGLNPEMLYL
jgi:hypothetical protein